MNTTTDNFRDAFNTPFFMGFHRDCNFEEALEIDVPLQVTAKEINIHKDKYENGFVNDGYLKLFALFRLIGKVDDLEAALSDYALVKLTEMKSKVADYKNGEEIIEFISDDYHIITKSVEAMEDYLGLKCNFYFVEVA